MKRGKNNKAKLALYIQKEVICRTKEILPTRSIAKSYYYMYLYDLYFSCYHYVTYTPYKKLKKRKLIKYKCYLDVLTKRRDV